MSEYKFDISTAPTLQDALSARLERSPGFERELEIARAETRFAVAVAEFRESRKLTQSDLGAIINLSQSRVAQIEKGNHSPSLETIVRIGSAFGARFIIEPDGSIKVQKTKSRRIDSKTALPKGAASR